MKMKLIPAAFAAGLLAACVSVQTETDMASETAPPMAGQQAAVSVVPQSALGPQTLAPGSCGLFLWSKTDTTKFIFFSEAATGTAKMVIGAAPERLTQTAAGGDIFGQFTTRLGYVSENGAQIALAMTPGDELEGGQRIESGLITTTDSEGWQTKLPVLGVRACQPQTVS